MASRLLPADKRPDVERLYAWCRWCDDGVDNSDSQSGARAFLDDAAADLQRIKTGSTPQARESRWLASLVARHDLPVEAAEALLAGMRSDLAGVSGLTEEGLMRYSFRVAGAVGVLMCPILGLGERRYLPHAAALGIGMQLTNIARDVAEDWQRSRCYLPVEWTDGLRVHAGSPDRRQVESGVRRLLDAADSFYRAGESGLVALPKRSRFAIHAASRIYHAIGVRIRRQGYRVLDGRTSVSLGGKMRLLAVAYVSRWSLVREEQLDTPAQEALHASRELLSEHGVG